MVGISESIDLDIKAALAKVKQLDTAITKAASGAKVDGAGVASATSGLRQVSTEAGNVERSVLGVNGVLANAKAGLLGIGQTAVNQVAPGLAPVTGHLKEIGSAASGAGGLLLGTAAAGVAVGLALGKMALSGIASVTELASQVRTVQRATGATAEDASRLVAVGKAVGVSAETEAAAFFKLSRNIESHGDVLAKDGIVVAKNSKGQIDLSATLLSVSDAYQKAGKGAAGNQVLFDAFGRSGLALAPILGLDRKQLEEFYAAAEKHHEILSQEDVDKARAYKIATHELGEAFGGVERELGLALIPALTLFARIVTDVIDGIDSAAHFLGPLTNLFGGLGTMIGGLAKDAFPEASFGLDLLRGHFRGAVVDLIPFGNSLHNLFFRHDEAKKAALEHAAAEAVIAGKVDETARATGVALPRLKQLAEEMGIDLASATDAENKKLAEAARKLNEAVTPSQILATVTKTLGNDFATTSEQVKAYKTALDATLGVALSVSDAEIGLRRSVSDLASEVAKGREKGESLTAQQDRLASSANGVVRSIEAEADALVKSGKLGADSASQTAFLRTRLLEVADAVPAVRGQIVAYVATLGQIPASQATTVSIDVTPALKSLGVLYDAFGTIVGTERRAVDAFGNDFTPAIVAEATKSGNQAGAALAKGLADAKAITDAVKSGTAIGQAAGTAAAEKAEKAIEVTLRRSAQPGQGLDLGGFIVSGIELGAAGNQVRANNAALALIGGMKSVVDKAQVIDPDEALGILEAVQNVDKAAKDLGDTQQKLGKDSIEAAIAARKLAAAQGEVNTKTVAAIDATEAVAKALADQKAAQEKARDSVRSYNKVITDSLDGLQGALSATRSLASAQRALRDATRDLQDVQGRAAALPGELAAADQELAAARTEAARTTTQEALAIVRARQAVIDAEDKAKKVLADSTSTDLDKQEATLSLADARDSLTDAQKDAVGPTDRVREAEQKVKDLQVEQAGIARRLEDATNGVTDAQYGLVDAQRRLIEQSDKLGGATDKALAYFRAIGTAAGLTRGEIDTMVESLRHAGDLAAAPLPGSPLATVPGPSSSPFLNTVTGRMAYTGPGGEAGGSLSELQDYARSHGIDPGNVRTWTQPGGQQVAYIPGVAVDPGNLGALAGVPNLGIGAGSASGGEGMVHAAGGSSTSYSVTFAPQTAQFDENTALSYMQMLELLSQ